MSKKKFVYVIRAGTGALKIGVAVNVEARRKQLQTSNCEVLKIVQVFGPFNAARKLELSIHKRLKESSLSGEWFSTKAATAVEIVEKELKSFVDDQDKEVVQTTVLEDMRFLFGPNFDKTIFGLAMSNRLHLLN